MSIVTEADSRAIVRLLGETAALDAGHQEMKRFLMQGICHLIKADAWVWTLGVRTEKHAAQYYVGIMHGGFDENRFANLVKATENPNQGKAVETFFQNVALNGTTTMTRDEIDPMDLAHQDGTREYWEAADIDSLMMSAHPMDDQSLSMQFVYRRCGETPFSPREKQILHIILDEVPWLHAAGWPEERGVKIPELFPKQRAVLYLLLDGLGRKKIAEHLSITPNTVDGYVKDVYRHFQVNSQTQLIHKFFCPDDSL